MHPRMNKRQALMFLLRACKYRDGGDFQKARQMQKKILRNIYQPFCIFTLGQQALDVDFQELCCIQAFEFSIRFASITQTL